MGECCPPAFFLWNFVTRATNGSTQVKNLLPSLCCGYRIHSLTVQVSPVLRGTSVPLPVPSALTTAKNENLSSVANLPTLSLVSSAYTPSVYGAATSNTVHFALSRVTLLGVQSTLPARRALLVSCVSASLLRIFLAECSYSTGVQCI